MIKTIEDQLLRDEGEELSAYQDHLGYWTIGVGRLIDERKGGGISKTESRYLLTNDVATREEALKRLIPWSASLSPQRFGVLLNMSFQMGVEGLLGFKNTLAMVRQGQYTQASLGMLQSLWAKQTPERAWRLSEQMRTGEWK